MQRVMRQLTYWKGKLSGAPELLELPTARARPAVQSHRGGRERFDIPAEVVEGLRALGREEGATLFMVLLAAFKVLMARYSGQEDVVVGTSIANRNHPDLQGLIGSFLNTLALRTDLSGEPSFREVLRRIRETTLEAYEHQDLPFEKLVEELNVERSPAHHPVFQVMFTLRSPEKRALKLGELEATSVSTDSHTAKFDLVAMLVEKEDGSVVGSCGYSTDLFDSATIERMMGHYGRLLESVVEDVERPIYEMAMLGEDERRQLLEEWNETGVSYPEASVHELFEGQVERTPEGIAVECEGERYTYRELNERANQVAHQLRRLGVGPEVRVGLCVERGMELVVGMLGVLKAGGAYVPLDPDYPPNGSRTTKSTDEGLHLGLLMGIVGLSEYNRMIFMVGAGDKTHWSTEPQNAPELRVANEFRDRLPNAEVRVALFEPLLSHFGHIERPKELAGGFFAALRWLVGVGGGAPQRKNAPGAF